jgi:O-6-methylguanine DNA methyltransferase
MKRGRYFEADFGGLRTRLAVCSDGTRITRLSFGALDADCETGSDRLIDAAVRQTQEYARGSRRVFDLPLGLRGTDFQMKVWDALLRIPYGQTRSYGAIAADAGNGAAARAAGGAVHRNPIALIVPCHRVIGSDGRLTGFGGGLPLKEALLRIEGWRG